MYKKFSLEQGLNLGFYNRNSNLEVTLIRHWLSLRMLDYNYSDKVSASLGCRRGGGGQLFSAYAGLQIKSIRSWCSIG